MPGGFFVYRAAVLFHEHRDEGDEPSAVAATNLALNDFLGGRWRGITPVLWGDQLRQERLDELIYLGVLGIDRLPVAAPAGVDWLVPSVTMDEERDTNYLQSAQSAQSAQRTQRRKGEDEKWE